MRTELLYHIIEDDAGKDIAGFLKEKGYSRNLTDDIKHLPDGLTVNGEEVYASMRLVSGDNLRVKLPEEKTNEWIKPEEMPLDIVYEDDDVLVLNKQAGVMVHATKDHPEGTLANSLRWYFERKGEPFTMRVINRLDQDTTGLLLIARHALSACVLGKEMSVRRIHRVYLAAATGNVYDVFPTGEGIIDAPIARVPGQGMLREVNFDIGEPAKTHVQIICYDPEFDITLCAVTLDTGRTHQIRVHFKYIGHPLPGDFLYNPDYRLIARQALHSWKLSFKQPITGEELNFTAPLPQDMRIFLPGNFSDVYIDEESC